MSSRSYSDVQTVLQTILATFAYPLPVVISLILDSQFGLPKLLIPFGRLIGLLLIPVGSILILLATIDLIRFGNGTPHPFAPTMNFVDKGLYSIVRHPIYLGWIVSLVGSIAYFQSFLMLESTAIIIVFIFFYARYEEGKLVERFGKRYAKYLKKVPGFLPC